MLHQWCFRYIYTHAYMYMYKQNLEFFRSCAPLYVHLQFVCRIFTSKNLLNMQSELHILKNQFYSNLLSLLVWEKNLLQVCIVYLYTYIWCTWAVYNVLMALSVGSVVDCLMMSEGRFPGTCPTSRTVYTSSASLPLCSYTSPVWLQSSPLELFLLMKLKTQWFVAYVFKSWIFVHYFPN